MRMQRILAIDASKSVGKEVKLAGWVHKVRELGAITFVVLRDRSGLIQAVANEKVRLPKLTLESVVEITGTIEKDDRSPLGVELKISKVEATSPVREDVPLELNKQDLNANLDTILSYRPISLRNIKQRAIFEIQAVIIQAFAEFLKSRGFTEIKSPKIVAAGAEGGADVFQVKYFGRKAYLTQSPQFYKQMMVGVYERVFEIGHAYRAEIHNTSRHINEYVSLDFEVGFIESFKDITGLETDFLRFLFRKLETCQDKLKLFGVDLPKLPKVIPMIKLAEAQEILAREYKKDIKGEPDLDPEGEKMISEYFLKKESSDFVFVTHFPSSKRPFYTMDDPKNPKETLGFDLIMRGLEVTTGGQRLHLYNDYLVKMKDRKMNHKDFEFYLQVFKYGMPPHGGLAIGLERLTMKLLGLENVREASLFPRDLNRLEP